MSDLRIDDTTTADAVGALRRAVARLAPVPRAAQALDTEVVGTNLLAADLDQADRNLAATIATLGKALTGLATEIDRAATTLTQTDTTLAKAAPRPAANGGPR